MFLGLRHLLTAGCQPPPSSDDHYQYTDPTLSSELSDDIIKQEANDANPSFTPEYVYDDFMLFPLKF